MMIRHGMTHDGSLIAVMMEAARTSEMLVNFYQTTRRYNPEDSYLRTHCHENLKSYTGDVQFHCTPVVSSVSDACRICDQKLIDYIEIHNDDLQ
jgi:hypothetical protein